MLIFVAGLFRVSFGSILGIHLDIVALPTWYRLEQSSKLNFSSSFISNIFLLKSIEYAILELQSFYYEIALSG